MIIVEYTLNHEKGPPRTFFLRANGLPNQKQWATRFDTEDKAHSAGKVKLDLIGQETASGDVVIGVEYFISFE